MSVIIAQVVIWHFTHGWPPQDDLWPYIFIMNIDVFQLKWDKCAKWRTSCCWDKHSGFCTLALPVFSLPPPFCCLTHLISSSRLPSQRRYSQLIRFLFPFVSHHLARDACSCGPKSQVAALCRRWNINQALMFINCPAQWLRCSVEPVPMATMAAVPLATASHPQKHQRGREKEDRRWELVVEEYQGGVQSLHHEQVRITAF